MGRQIELTLSPEQEEEFLRFLGNGADIAIIKSFAQSVDELWVECFSPPSPGHYTYYIWNRAYPWVPEYRQTKTESASWYVSNMSAAPLLEYSRRPPNQVDPGRLYWAKGFSAPHGLAYDHVAFSAWVDSIWAWVRKARRRGDA